MNIHYLLQVLQLLLGGHVGLGVFVGSAYVYMLLLLYYHCQCMLCSSVSYCSY